MSSIIIVDSHILECCLNSVVSNRTWFISIVHLTARPAGSAEAVSISFSYSDSDQIRQFGGDPANWRNTKSLGIYEPIIIYDSKITMASYKKVISTQSL